MPQEPEYTYRSDRLGRLAERFVRAFGMPWFLAGQTAVIALWIALNALVPVLRFDPYPFIFMNLVFSALAAYAAPFILLAQTRQADRDKARSESDVRHREQMVIDQARLLDENRRQTEHIADLLQQMRQLFERESDQSELIMTLASRTIATAQASHELTREIHGAVTRESRPASR